MGRKVTKKCPICGKPAEEKHDPFCSDRCAKIDLGRWLGEVYTVPTEDSPPFADDSENAS